MIRLGDYIAVTEKLNAETKVFHIRHIKNKERHCHVSKSLGHRTVKILMQCAVSGIIDAEASAYIVKNVNRLWFGENFLDREDLHNENLFVKDPSVRLKKKRKRGAKHYHNCTGKKVSNVYKNTLPYE